MYVEIERAPKSLDDRHRATAPVHHAIRARSPAEEAENRTHGAPHDGAAQGVVPGQPVAEAVGQTQHPLPHRHLREHAVDQRSPRSASVGRSLTGRPRLGKGRARAT